MNHEAPSLPAYAERRIADAEASFRRNLQSPLAAETLEALESALADALAPNTRRAYSAAWRSFTDYAAGSGECVMPALPEVVAGFVATRQVAGLSISSIRLALAAIAKAHQVQGHGNPCAHTLVRETVRGFARQQSTRTRRQAKPLTVEAVAAIRGSLNGKADANWRTARDIALVSVLASAALRRSEASALTWRDVDLESQTLTVRRSKTDQDGEGAVVALSQHAVRDLARLRTMRPADDGASVFGVSDSQICRIVKRLAEQAGLGTGFSGHSGRVGVAITMTKAGAPAQVVQRQGRWTDSKMLSTYTRQLAATDAAQYLG